MSVIFGYLLWGFILLTFFVFPIPCLIWVIYSIVKYVKCRKNGNADEIHIRKEKMIKSIVFSAIEGFIFGLELWIVIMLITHPINLM